MIVAFSNESFITVLTVIKLAIEFENVSNSLAILIIFFSTCICNYTYLYGDKIYN